MAIIKVKRPKPTPERPTDDLFDEIYWDAEEIKKYLSLADAHNLWCDVQKTKTHIEARAMAAITYRQAAEGLEAAAKILREKAVDFNGRAGLSLTMPGRK